MKTEFKIFLTALMFYTRFPIKNIEGWNETMLNKSTRYFTLIGLLVGGLGALMFWGAVQVFPVQVAILLSMIATVFFTGAFHEDGFADFCDGFGGGNSPAKILLIMKDSRIGTYGTAGLVFILGMKFLTLSGIAISQIPLVIIAGHAVSRLFPVLLIYTSEYVRIDATSKTKPIGKADSVGSLLLAVGIGVITLLLLPWKESVVALVVLFAVFYLFRFYINKKLGGYTGDILGALQQLSEVFFYLALLGVQNF
jgi:adenosylcobinamide-GDP ribazoletransferase